MNTLVFETNVLYIMVEIISLYKKSSIKCLFRMGSKILMIFRNKKSFWLFYRHLQLNGIGYIVKVFVRSIPLLVRGQDQL